VLVVDDSPDFLMALSDLLSGAPSVTVVGEASTGEEALLRAPALRPDLVVMDLSMPGMNGIETAHRLKTSAHPPKVLLVTLHDGSEYRVRAAAAGVDGFLQKSDTGQALLPMIASLFPLSDVR
jgi:DNA-binding NarL/FixJ family response regulator